MKYVVGITAKLLVICTITALLLSVVNALTAERIIANTEAEKRAAISSIFGNSIDTQLYPAELDGISELYLVTVDGSPLGYVAQVAPKGFGGEMIIMVGVSVDGTIKGVKLVSHSETPGLGNRVGEDFHTSKYIGQRADTLSVDAITGSTVSSTALKSGVETALSVFNIIFRVSDGGIQ